MCVVLAVSFAYCACEDKPKGSNSSLPATASAVPTAATSKLSEPEGPPGLAIDSIGVKLGFSRILLDKPEGTERLRQELSSQRIRFSGKEIALSVDRSAKPAFVSSVIDELAKLSVTGIRIRTETRKEFPNELEFTPRALALSAPRCSVIAMILEDRGTAVWKLSGGTASKRARGFAGPDLSMTGDTLERFAKACRDSKTLFVAAAGAVEWGLIYDLAASAKSLPAGGFEHFALVAETPTPGRRVTL